VTLTIGDVEMDMNLVVIAGRLAADPEIRIGGDGGSSLKLLVTVASGGDSSPRRLDVVPAVLWKDDVHDIAAAVKGDRVWCVGALQRTFHTDGRDGHQSRMQVAIHEVTRMEDTDGIG
jgi:single-stranded DNA-binding protein